MNSVIRNIYGAGSVEDRDGHSIDIFPTSIQYDEGTALYNLIRKVKGGAYLRDRNGLWFINFIYLSSSLR